MPGVIGAGVPSLSQVYDWDTAHLHHAATDWTATAERWEESFTQVHRGALSPGGTVWEGHAAEAVRARAFADLVKVRGLADSLHEAVAVARRGAQRLDYVKRRAIDAISAAQAAGFDVRDDLSVTGHVRGRDVLAAQRYAATIAARVGELGTTDKEVAAEITTATAGLANPGLAELSQDEAVEVVGYKTAPPDRPLSEARRRAIAYADLWAGDAGDPHRGNPDYENFGDRGGDCTNFASQVMRAGGLQDVGNGIDDWHRGDADDWYYNNGPSFPGNERSNTWSAAKANHDFVTQSGRGQVVGTTPMPTATSLDPLAPSNAGLVPGDLIYYYDANGTINHTAVYVGQKMENGALVDIVDQHANGDNNLRNDWMPDGTDFIGGSASAEFVHLTYSGE